MTEKANSNIPYRNPSLSIEDRVGDLLARMTLDEKIAQLGSVWVFELSNGNRLDLERAQARMSAGIGQITRVAGASNLSPGEAAALANQAQRFLREDTRLGIPAIVHEECCSGFMARGATCFPQTIGLACTWEPELAEAMATVVRTQMRAAGAQQGLSPLLDITRDPRWGRVEETFGEDPYLVARMGVSFVQGLQGETRQEGILATAKHFVGCGVPEGGMNWAPPHIGARELRELYLLPFEAAVKKANLQSIMNAYNELDGVPCAASHELLTTILREEWGFEGLVVSDYFAIEQLIRAHQTAGEEQQAAAVALEAGIDVELPSTHCYGQPLKQAVLEGAVSEALVDRSVARLLAMKFKLGLFEAPYVDAEAAPELFDGIEQRKLARTIAQKAIVLLKNEGDLLPLSTEIGSIAVIGPNADSKRNLLGDYAYVCHIESLIESRDSDNAFNVPVPDDMVLVDALMPMKTILESLGQKISADTQLRYAEGCQISGDNRSGFAEAVKIAEQSDVAVLVMGGKSGLSDDCTCGEARDRADIGLPGSQLELIQAVQATGTPTVLVLINGRPLSVEWAAEHVPAILEVWLPGQEGADAVADVLFGDVNPGGKLAITFPRSSGQIPIFYSHKPSGGRSHWKGAYADLSNAPLWPFGYGLSYTQFRLDNLIVDRAQIAPGDQVNISLEISNIGELAGDEVVQLYARDLLATVSRPVKELKGFKRIHLAPGECKTVTFTLFANQLAFYDQEMNFVVEPGEIELMVGTSSQDIQLRDTIELVGEKLDVSAEKIFFGQARLG